MEVISRKWAVAGATQSCVAAGCSCFAAVSSSAPELLVGFCGPRKKVIPSLLLSIYPSIYLSFFFFFFFFPSSSSSLSRYPKRCACLCLRAVRPMPKLLARHPPLHKKKCFFFSSSSFEEGGEKTKQREREKEMKSAFIPKGRQTLQRLPWTTRYVEEEQIPRLSKGKNR